MAPHLLLLLLLGTFGPPSTLSSSSVITRVMFVIHEELPLGTAVGDPASKARLRHSYPLDFPHFTYAILAREQPPYFQLQSPSNSTLIVSRRIDREQLCAEGVATCCVKEGEHECRLELEMNVNYNSITRHSMTVVLTVKDINDNGCHFEPTTGNGVQHVSFLEGDSSGEETLRSPVDLDWDFPVRQNRIRLRPQDPSFDLVTARGFSRRKFRVQLRLRKALDRERKAQYWLTVVADDGRSEHECQLRVNVTVLDRNDNAPVFERLVYRRDVNETDSVPLDVLRVTAHDADEGENARLTYHIDRLSLSESAANLFEVDPERGVISLRRPLRFDAREKHHQLLVLAKDHGRRFRRTGSATVVITVLDINNNDPVIQVLNLRGGRRISIPEEQTPPVGVASIVVSDEDENFNSKVRCHLQTTTQFLLREMGSGSFQVVSNRIFDREAAPTKSFGIVCNDMGVPRRTAVQQVIVHIDDVNDHAPRFTQSLYKVKVSEDSNPKRFSRNYKITRVSASDQDEGRNAEVRYSLARVPRWQDEELFSIDAETGWVKSNGKLDRERQATYNLTVVATDRGLPRGRTGSAVVHVIVTDYNDHKPLFAKFHHNFYLRENVNVNSLVDTLTVVDLDTEDNGRLEFKVKSDTAVWRLPFRVSGVYASDENRYRVSIYTTKPIDREELVSSDRGHQTSVNPVYKFYVMARDWGSPDRLSSTAEVSVHIIDENDETPQFTSPLANNTRVSVSYRERVGKEVLRLEAFDRDAGKNGSLIYSLRSGNQMGYFAVDPLKGIIRIAKPLPKTAVGHYTVEAVVSDRGHEPRSARINVDIAIDSSAPKNPQRSNRKLSTRAINLYIIIAIVASSFVVSLVLLGVICFIMRRNKRRRMREGEPYTKTDCSGLSTNLSDRSVSNLVQRNEHVHLQNHRQPPPYQSVPMDDPRSPGADEPPLSFTDGHAVEVVTKPKQERFAYTPLVSSFDSPSYRPRCHAESSTLPPAACNGFALVSKTTSIDRKRPGHRPTPGTSALDCPTFPRDLHRLTDTFI